MLIHYIKHSGIAVENDNIMVIVDYWKGKIDTQCKKQVYVLVSHSHQDHYNQDILSWQGNIKYIFSRDIICDEKGIIFLDKGEEYRDENIYIKAYGSTDEGISFYFEFGGKKIVHAGDLNNWHWNKESTQEFAQEAEEAFLVELNELANDVSDLDIAFFPLDKRLGEDYMRGAEQFTDKINCTYLAPIHFWESYKSIAAFEPYANKKGIKLIEWTIPGQTLDI